MAWVPVNNLGSGHPTISPHQNDKKEKSPQKRKDNESVASAKELMGMDITKYQKWNSE